MELVLGERWLQLSSEKTAITQIEAGFDFLGKTVRKFKGKLLIKPSKEARCAFLRKVREVIKANKAVAAGALVRFLNPLIRGWVHYHRHVVSSNTFAHVDHERWKALWGRASGRNPTKNLGGEGDK